MSVAQIIDRAENTPAPFRAGLFASVLSGLCLWACFPPLDLGFLAWLAPLPWLMLIRLCFFLAIGVLISPVQLLGVCNSTSSCAPAILFN